jgi:hypothetical protein
MLNGRRSARRMFEVSSSSSSGSSKDELEVSIAPCVNTSAICTSEAKRYMHNMSNCSSAPGALQRAALLGS